MKREKTIMGYKKKEFDKLPEWLQERYKEFELDNQKNAPTLSEILLEIILLGGLFLYAIYCLPGGIK